MWWIKTMPYCLLPKLFPLLFFSCLLVLVPRSASFNDYCLANNTADSNFEANVNLLLTSLSSKAPSTGFYNDTEGVAPDQVQGLALCRGDISPEECQSCLNGAVNLTAQRCPRGKSYAVWFDECLLRYSNQSSFAETSFKVYMSNTANVSDPSSFDTLLRKLMDNLTMEAAYGSSRMFADGSVSYMSFRTLYGLVWCTRDLPHDVCYRCLKDAEGSIQDVCATKQGCVILEMNCYLRFELYPFYNLSASALATPPTPVAPAPQTSADKSDGKHSNTLKIALIIAIPVILAVILLSAICIRFQRKTKFNRIVSGGNHQEIREVDLLFDLGTLRAATNNFSDANKLGEGGFGPVYKGTLRSGEEIAVKMLKGGSSQGVIELRNEVLLLARLQHRNLVRLLGFCMEEQEKMIVYEYLPNTSLDKILFDPRGCQQLDWGRRYKIIEGIARGLVYLHEDSRLRIIHRDLKLSNILLDKDMNPKISDFGLAKLSGVEDTHGNTSRIAGTYGYMAPEYAMQGVFSTKSDVFSFGVLILEIVTGRRNTDFQGSGNTINLLSHVWQYWQDNRALQLKDQSLGDHYRREEFLRCVHIGLLCIQEDPAERPNMATVVLLLSSHSVSLPSPSMPAFFIGGSIASESNVLMSNANLDAPELYRSNKSVQRTRSISKNEVTISELDPR